MYNLKILYTFNRKFTLFRKYSLKITNNIKIFIYVRMKTNICFSKNQIKLYKTWKNVIIFNRNLQ